jgi:DDE superfamily endonuclease
VGAHERDEFLRVAWTVKVAREIAAERLVFVVDEMGTNTSLHPLYAWSPRGERAHYFVPRNRGPNTTLLASMTAEGMGPCLAVEGATSRIVFEAYIEKVLVPSLRCGQVVVMDNLSAQGRTTRQGAHRERRLRATLSAAVLTGLQPHRRDLLEG